MIHQSFFSSSIVEADVTTKYVFMSMIALSDEDGRIDMTRSALARLLNLSTESLDGAIAVLSGPDEMSRTRDHDGRRIVPIDPSRSWGWIVVNKSVYRYSDEARREYERERKREYRERKREESHPPLHSSTDDRSQIANTHTESPNVSGTHRDRSQRKHSRSFTDDSQEMQLARLLRDERNAAGCLHTEPDLHEWAATFSEILQIDKRDPELVEQIIRHIVADPKKQQYLLSPGALRTKWQDGSLKFDAFAADVKALAARRLPGFTI